MGKEVTFSFSSAEEKLAFKKYAASKGLTLSGLAKLATYQYKAKYPTKDRENCTASRVEGDSKEDL